MNARPQFRNILIAKKLRRWCLIAQHPSINRNCSPARARRNYWRLFAKYPELAASLGLTETSVYML
jgi:hypothetical protein